MAKAFYWDDLLDCLTSPGTRPVVPVVGNELLRVPDVENPGGDPVPFSDLLARRCARWLNTRHGLDLAADAALPAQMRAARREDVDFSPAVHAAHQVIISEVRRAGPAALPEPLRLLADMGAFPFFVSTTADDLLGLALGVSRPEEAVAAQLDKLVDLPLGWQPGQAPGLFQLFGRFGAGGGEPAITEEDTLEYLAHLHDKGRPVRLLSHLRQSHLLLLGNQHPDWLARVFLRFLRDHRFVGGGRAAFEALADTEARGDAPGAGSLVRFLSAYSPKTRVYEEANAASFIRTLHAKWRERTGAAPSVLAPEESAATGSIAVNDDEGNVEPAPMGDAAIFLSYASQDRPAAEAMATALAARKLPVWLDRRELQGGDIYAHRIDENIRRCRLFVPLLSRQTAARQEGWFRREWLKARERLETVGPGLTFVIPVAVDDSRVYGSDDLQRYFTLGGHEPHVLTCPGGVPDAGQLDQFVQKFRAAVRS